MDTEKITKYIEENISGDAMGAISLFIAVATMFIWNYVSRKADDNLGKKKPLTMDEKPVALNPTEQLENIYLRYENEFKNRIAKIMELYSPDDDKDIYERNYCNEMLLKLLIELDGVDLLNLEGEKRKQLRQRRKDIIKIIQNELVNLDSLK
ncbi:similar to Saccharomyces cerevisiae YIL016W SNL1 Protein of unknown function proposed to be involved in nuclear pore complex biogenesis and maintenance as well as protein folding [Maudiozyma barnettii]|uniref:BAG domain-containing protein n=1 Tax=Maudiozyma barnettii TaxID=61262 RepID=A0A8H2VHW2_9SACH|nr:Snl1p [Kazachstania barnettii]CAB4255751.1 similar to Saccharomyces cerevisiae YIL016W SNL1 Protein of unknown function proposed to be involved in nuclear pore complex biogenesis and maintenance as well as protein folding [Kazachstania barnettii]CAD1784312.1 similar to Saccharomyces cerevisiae YIL016W SNL1 Protein of unknown function proposed to be involved in nuclear pore complex biogenesis and maintenance as well as protein folding [Kazachstania barnettii]